MLISRDGETILVNPNFLEEDLQIVLTQSDGKLSFESGLGPAQLGLSEDENTLRIAELSYKRIDEVRANELKVQLEAEKEQKLKNKELCQQLNDEYANKRKLVIEAHPDPASSGVFGSVPSIVKIKG